MNTSNDNSSTGTADCCANCGKEGSDVNNICNKCKKVKYCNAACKKKHRHKHKEECEENVRLAAEQAAELHDEKLFKQPPPLEDCPICFQQLPVLNPTGKKYQSCCGKVICGGCAYAPLYDDQGNEVDNKKCPYCRTPWPYTDEEIVEREKKRVEANDPLAIYNIGCYYRDGRNGYRQDYTKALELYHRAAELGCSVAYCSIGYAYHNGELGVAVDIKKATYYYEIAAMGADVDARHNLGVDEVDAGNIDRAIKHYMIAIRDGNTDSLKEIRELYKCGHATKDDYAKALQAHQVYLDEIKSTQRDEAAAFDNEEYRYY